MTSATGLHDTDDLSFAVMGTHLTSTGPAVALLVALLAAQSSDVALATSYSRDERSTTQLTAFVDYQGLLHELIAFHQRLADSQQDLPEDAARVLRARLWQLYD